MKITIPSSIPSDNVKVIDTVKIGFGHESFWLDFGENDMVTLEKEEIFLFQCFVVRVLVGSQSEIVLHSELNEAISESTPESLTASEKLRNKISSLNRQFNEKGKPPDRKQWIRSDKGKGYYLNKTVKWDADEDTIRNRKTNSAYIQLVLPSDVIDNWKKGKEGDD